MMQESSATYRPVAAVRMKESGHQYEAKVKSTLRLAHHAIFRIVLNRCERVWELPMRAGPGSVDKDC